MISSIHAQQSVTYFELLQYLFKNYSCPKMILYGSGQYPSSTRRLIIINISDKHDSDSE
jgi:hypothetical protein